MPTRLVVALGACALLAVGTTSSAGAADPGVKCAAAKRKAAGKNVSSRLVCVARAKAKSVPIDPRCLAKADAKFEAAFAKAGAACPGMPPEIAVLADSCVDALTADAPGDGRCPSKSATAIGAAARAEMNCAARDVVRPGSYAVCKARSIAKLAIALANAGLCAAPGAAGDVQVCEQVLAAALVAGAPPPTVAM